MLEGSRYDQDGVSRDTRAIVKHYSTVGGYIYEQQPGQSPNPDYLQINAKRVFKRQPGRLDLVYEISEGKQFRLGRILTKGNGKTRDNVILREMHMRPGQEYDSSEVADAADRLRGTPYFSTVNVTAVGDSPESRDLLVEVTENRTAQISAGVGVNSNGGFGGNISYEQKNFDISNPPGSWSELFSDRAFTGAGQDFRAASIRAPSAPMPPSPSPSLTSSISPTASRSRDISAIASARTTTTTATAAPSDLASASTTSTAPTSSSPAKTWKFAASLIPKPARPKSWKAPATTPSRASPVNSAAIPPTTAPSPTKAAMPISASSRPAAGRRHQLHPPYLQLQRLPDHQHRSPGSQNRVE